MKAKRNANYIYSASVNFNLQQITTNIRDHSPSQTPCRGHMQNPLKINIHRMVCMYVYYHVICPVNA